MTADDVLAELIHICPDFRAAWSSSLFLDADGSFTACGVFSEFSGHIGSRHTRMPADQLRALGVLVSRCEADASVADAVYTCFLENIAGEPADEAIAPYLSNTAREYMSHWKPHP